MTQQSFDRVRARVDVGGESAPVDVQGKTALFSSEAVVPTLGSVAITCSQCRNATVVSYGRAVRLSIPSVHLPLMGRDYPTWMRCPACDERHWVRVRLRLR